MSQTIAPHSSAVIDTERILNSVSLTPSEASIFRVGNYLRNLNSEAYEPEIVAIGPFHKGKHNLQEMELYKGKYLKMFLQRINESNVEKCFTAIQPLEDRARKCYAEYIDLDDKTFSQMLIFDGCFIIEFLLLFQHKECGYEGNPIFEHKHLQSHLLHDLLLFENQIPFFIVECLFNMVPLKNGENIINSLIYPLLHFSIFPVPRENLPEVPPDNSLHLLSIVHNIQCSSFASLVFPIDTENPSEMVNINSAVELKEAGICIQKSDNHSLFRIEFQNKTIKIAQWEFCDSTESLFRNLVAYEYYLKGSPQKYVTDFIFFMHCLVHSPEDTKLLRRCGIISNLLGSDEMVYHVINQLGKNIIVSEKFSYSNIFNVVSRHCHSKWNIRMATLRRNYLNGPWARISVLAATLLLVLTITQALFAILSYRNDLK